MGMLLGGTIEDKKKYMEKGPRGEVLGLEKGTDCGPSAAKLWLSRANNAKKGGLSSH